MEYANHRKHSAGARNVKARAKRALLLPSVLYFGSLTATMTKTERLFQ